MIVLAEFLIIFRMKFRRYWKIYWFFKPAGLYYWWESFFIWLLLPQKLVASSMNKAKKCRLFYVWCISWIYKWRIVFILGYRMNIIVENDTYWKCPVLIHFFIAATSPITCVVLFFIYYCKVCLSIRQFLLTSILTLSGHDI